MPLPIVRIASCDAVAEVAGTRKDCFDKLEARKVEFETRRRFRGRSSSSESSESGGDS